MSEQRNFTLIGNFTDNITSKLNSIQTTINKLNSSFSKPASRGGGIGRLTAGLRKVSKELGTLSSAHKSYRESVRESASAERDFSNALGKSVQSMRLYRSSLGRVTGSHIRMRSSSQVMGSALASSWNTANAALLSYIRNQNRVRSRFPSPPRGGGYGGGYGGGPSGAGPTGMSPQGASSMRRSGGRTANFIKDFMVANLIMWLGRSLQMGIQRAINSVFRAFAERAKDQLEDIASAGGIFSAAKFGGAKGLPATFQGAMEMQDEINKQMASVASALPGTTQDYVMNARRMTDTLAQIMTNDLKGFEKFAQKISGDTRAKGAKAFTIVNVEIAKATTLLEKLNPTRTIVPTTQIVEDMMKSQMVSVAGLRRYVSFRRATTFEAALQKNLKNLNKTGAGTAARLEMITKVLREAVPPELITAMTKSVSGVVEATKSAIFDPDVGIFGLSRILSLSVRKFNIETGEVIKDKFGMAVEDTTNLFKLFGETFGNLGNLFTSAILPGIASIYSPFEGIADSLVNLRDYSYKVFESQQSYSAFLSNLADKYKMSYESFKVQEKAGLTVLIDILKDYGMVNKDVASRMYEIMKKPGSEEQIGIDIKQIYKEIIPKIFDSPFFQAIGEHIGYIMGEALTALADLLDVVAKVGDPNVSAFSKAFQAGGGYKAIDRILVNVVKGIVIVIKQVIEILFSSLVEAIKGGNFLAAVFMLAVPAAMGLFIPGVQRIITFLVRSILGTLDYLFTGGKVGTLLSIIASSRAVAGSVVPPTTPRPSPYIPGLSYGIRKPGARIPTQMAPGSVSGGAIGGLRGIFPGGLKAATRGLVGGSILGFGLNVAMGDNIGKAAAGAITGTLGATLGAILLPALGPVGAIIGGMAGDFIGRSIYDALNPPTKQQQIAAAKQVEAAELQKEAALVRKSGVNALGGYMSLGSVGELRERLSYLGVNDSVAGQIVGKYQLQASAVQAAAASAKDLNAKISAMRQRYGTSILPKEVVEQDIGPFQVKYNQDKARAEAAIKGVSSVFEGIGPQLRQKILNSFEVMPIKSEELQQRISAAKIAAQMGGSSSEQRENKERLSKYSTFWQNIENFFSFLRPSFSARGSLGTAIASEMRHKPPGSDLVIANSSETVIPAARGYGMGAFIDQIAITSRNTAATANLLVSIKKSINDLHFNIKEIRDITKESLSLSMGSTPNNYYASAASNYELAYAAMPTSSSSSNYGGSMSRYKIDAPITIYQQPGQDSEELAAMVAARIGMAIDEARNAG